MTAQVDPFYVKALSEGERLLAAEDFVNAALSLEIAVFGLHDDRTSLSRALGALALAAYKAGQTEKSRDAVRRLTVLVDRNTISAMAMREDWKAELVRLVAYFEETPAGSDRPEEDRSKILSKTKTGALDKVSLERQRVAELEKRLKQKPESAADFLELYDLYRRLENPRAAKKTLQQLAARIPQEPRGHFLLGKTFFAERKFKAALKHFEKAISLGGDAPSPADLTISSQGYSILTLNSLGRKEELEERSRGLAAGVEESRISSLDMGDREKAILQSILTPYYQGYRGTAEGPPPEAKPPARVVPAPVESKPAAVSLAQEEAAARAYGLFDQYLQDKNPASARRTLETLLRRYPSEVRAVHLLGKLDYQQRKYGQAEERFQAAINGSRKTGDREGILSEAAAYLVLCARELRGHEAARNLSRSYRSELEGAALDGMGLEGADKQLIRDYLKGPQAGSLVDRAVEKISVQDTAEGLRIEIVCIPMTTFRAFVLEGDKKIIIDLFNVSRILSERILPVRARGVQTVRTSMFQEQTARVVLDIQDRIPPYSIRETSTGLVILIR